MPPRSATSSSSSSRSSQPSSSGCCERTSEAVMSITTTPVPATTTAPAAPPSTSHRPKGRWWLYALLTVAVVVVAAPFVWMVVGSLKPTTELRQVPPTWLPENPTLDNYTQLFSRLDFTTYFVNSTVVALVVTAGNLLFCSMLGYALAMLNFRGKNVVFVAVLAT